MTHLISAWLALIAMTASPSSAPREATGQRVPNFSIRTWPASTPIAVGHEPQLLVDNYLIAEHRGLAYTTHSPRRVSDGPILGRQAGTGQPYLTVLRDPETGKYRMWYNRYTNEVLSVAYAESGDGIHWETPRLGILGDDNRLFNISTPGRGGFGATIIDEGPSYPDKSSRFKMAWYGQEKPDASDRGMRVAFSPDGLHWTPWRENPVLRASSSDPVCPDCVGDIIDVYRDPIRHRYGAFVKLAAMPSDGYTRGRKAKGGIRRLVGASASDDFTHWQQPWRVVVPEPRNQGQLEFYSVGGTIARGGLLIGFARMLHDDLPATEGGPIEGIGYATLVTSRDGKCWDRHDDIFFNRNLDPDAWDHAMAWIGSALDVGDELYLYYGGYQRGHKIERLKERQLGLAKMPMDRFVSRDAVGRVPGRLLTVPLQLPESGAAALVLNADAAKGRIRVQLRDAEGDNVLAGYTLDDCEPTTGDGLALPVRWRGREGFPNRIIRIEFEVTNASLFGFRFAPPAEAPPSRNATE